MFAVNPSDGGYSEAMFEYPDIPEFSVREKLIQEKEAGGMFFSGHLLDDYTNHISDIDHIPLSELSGDSPEDSVIKDKQYVKIVGIITSVTPKTTKKDERMAFFSVEDRFTSVECIAFPNRYIRESQNIRLDAAVLIEGNAVVREEEKIRIAIQHIIPLENNSRYTPKSKDAMAEAECKSDENVSKETKKSDDSPKRLFLRVPDRECEVFLKAVNLVDIFEGNMGVVFYRCDEKSYFAYSRGVALSEFVVSELRSLLGDENVIIK